MTRTPFRVLLCAVVLAGAATNQTLFGAGPGAATPRGGAGQARPMAARPSLTLHYVANCGVAVGAGDTTILIDALFDRPNPAYRAPSAETIDKMVAGVPPFDNVKLALVTHNHPDHFDARVALRFLEHRHEAVLVAPPDAIAAMREAASDWSRVARRVVTIDGPAGARVERKVGDVFVTAFRTNHGSSHSQTPPNAMYLVDLHGWRVFHDGDSPGNVDEYERAGLGGLPVDLALVQSWFPTDFNGGRFLRDVLRPAHLALTHVSIARETGAPALIDEIRKDHHDVFVLLPGMPPRRF